MRVTAVVFAGVLVCGGPAAAFPSLCPQYQHLDKLCRSTGSPAVCAARGELAGRMNKDWDQCPFTVPSRIDTLAGCSAVEETCKHFR
jgi:hypothetical protein